MGNSACPDWAAIPVQCRIPGGHRQAYDLASMQACLYLKSMKRAHWEQAFREGISECPPSLMQQPHIGGELTLHVLMVQQVI